MVCVDEEKSGNFSEWEVIDETVQIGGSCSSSSSPCNMT
jgi:hypothetical protein